MPARHIDRAGNMAGGKLGFGTHVDEVIDTIGGMLQLDRSSCSGVVHAIFSSAAIFSAAAIA